MSDTTTQTNSQSPTLDHPVFATLKSKFPELNLRGTEFRGQASVIVEPKDLHQVMAFLRNDPRCDFNFLSDVTAVDYHDYPAQTLGRFAVVYNLCAYSRDDRIIVKTFLDPSIPTDGIVPDPALEVDSVTDLWPGASWTEREFYDMYGIRFANHPDLRRSLTWGDCPADPLRKDYPLRGRGERESYRVVDRTSS